VAPSNTAISSALNYTLASQTGSTTSSNTTGVTSHGYYVINSTGSSLVNDVKTALANNKPVMMGFNVYDNTRTYKYFEGLNTSSYTYNPLSTSGQLASGVRLLGGHAVPIIGYINDATQPGGGVFVVENSWGKPWGNQGFFYLPYSVIQSTKVVPAGSLYVAIL
jgi:C1A family cysteine protease